MMALKLKTFYNSILQWNIFKNLKSPRLMLLSSKAAYSSKCYVDFDPAGAFFSPVVQNILSHLTGFDIVKVHQNDPLPIKSELVFATDEELQERIDAANEKAKLLLQMPPVVQMAQDNVRSISMDPAMQGYLRGRYIFTDISEDIPEKERIVVVREMNGELRTATIDEAFRMNLIYSPSHNRFLSLAPIFDDEDSFMDAMARKEHRFILDFACHQLEPTNSKYHEVTSGIYKNILLTEDYDILISTRHFGPMAFYLAWNRELEGLIVYYINNDLIVEAASAVNLFNIIHNKKELDMNLSSPIDKCIDILKQSDEIMGREPTGRINMAIQRYNERRKQDKPQTSVEQ